MGHKNAIPTSLVVSDAILPVSPTLGFLIGFPYGPYRRPHHRCLWCDQPPRFPGLVWNFHIGWPIWKCAGPSNNSSGPH